MDLVRSWLGQALRATGAAVVVPVAILLALSLAGLGGGGLGGLGSLSQIVSGPDVAGGDVARVDGDSEISEAVAQLAAARLAAPDAGPQSGSGGGGDKGSGQQQGAGRGHGGGGTDPGGGGGDGPSGDPDGGGNGGGGNGGGGGDDDGTRPEPPPPEERGLVESLGDTVEEVTKDTPISPTVEDAIDGLIDVCGQLRCP